MTCHDLSATTHHGPSILSRSTTLGLRGVRPGAPTESVSGRGGPASGAMRRFAAVVRRWLPSPADTPTSRTRPEVPGADLRR